MRAEHHHVKVILVGETLGPFQEAYAGEIERVGAEQRYQAENEQEQKKVEVMPDRKNRFIAPSSQVILNSDIDKIVNLETGIVRSFQKENSLIYYWNRDQWMELH